MISLFFKATVSLIGAAAGLAAGLSYTLFIFGFKNASSIGNPQTTLPIAFFSFCLFLFLFTDKGEAAEVIMSGDIGWFLLVGVLGAGMSFIFYVIDIGFTPPSTASMVAMVEPVTASLFGVLLMGDNLTFIQIFGMVFILCTVSVLSSVKQSD
ncbi:DMT family transporter [Salibacterium aidingense]|uniref:DMT family transporter n=1 Tax=Salibacterium aidingense TaxID=384933 RepID=UPI00042311AB|nr:DMT family transporter [Salibacterium aidingense]